MSKRTLIKNCIPEVGKEVIINGWVQTVRSHGKIAFLDVMDRSAIIQVVCTGEQLGDIRPQFVVSIIGIVANRPEKLINPNISTGGIELQANKINILSKAEELPFDMGSKDLNLQLPTLLDYRALTLKHPKVKMIFKIQSALVKEFRKAAEELECEEVFVSAIASGATEGGAEVFSIDYFGHRAFLTQSPQIYKQIMVGALERVFTIAKAYRAEPSVTTRHLTEATQMDIEMAFVTLEELLDSLEFVGVYMVKNVSEKYENILKEFNVEKPLISSTVPRLTLREAQAIITKRTGRNLSGELDLNPEDEKEICAWGKEEHQSDFVTITHFPTKKRAFYTMPDSNNPEYSLSYDLLFRGIEILSGSQRINEYEQLIESMKNKGVNPEKFNIYTMAFKYGMPPEGGFSFGLERLTMKLLDLQNIREASLFPRDMDRIDERLHPVHK
ncbi:aspartate--tRNA(Asn) ligase [Candidatus Levyibacteriota bacterium]|nr:aspartate--tRNA(Asn) ligase [Candidatus Levybacteria bacterium]GDX61763.1 aspartate--tRNA(Asn) ligase [Candidatus Levybacteria bacterium]